MMKGMERNLDQCTACGANCEPGDGRKVIFLDLAEIHNTNHSHPSSYWSTRGRPANWITCKGEVLSPNIQPCPLPEDFQLLQKIVSRWGSSCLQKIVSVLWWRWSHLQKIVWAKIDNKNETEGQIPAGVPVMMISPGWSWNRRDSSAIISSTCAMHSASIHTIRAFKSF